MKMRILVCGGRDYSDYDRIKEVLKPYGEDVILIHGDAHGADRYAGRVGRELGWWVWPCPANWDNQGRSAGALRNQAMLESSNPDLVVAFPGGVGTDDMVYRATAAGVMVQRILPGGDQP